ncbi:hypothetical protein [Terrabacter carboxydivorans]|uniref:hypothetical protein n=1 Tax=Terrabacter carboxydivorans TaxID=619730 RepID=UPI0031D38C5C
MSTISQSKYICPDYPSVARSRSASDLALVTMQNLADTVNFILPQTDSLAALKRRGLLVLRVRRASEALAPVVAELHRTPGAGGGRPRGLGCFGQPNQGMRFGRHFRPGHARPQQAALRVACNGAMLGVDKSGSGAVVDPPSGRRPALIAIHQA